MKRNLFGNSATENRQLIVFDLDGTLVDSLPVLTFCVNRMRSEHGLTALASDQIAGMSGGPMHSFLRRAVSIGGPESNASDEEIGCEYGGHYRRACRSGLMRAYAGTGAMLRSVTEAGHAIAICTNKSQELALVTTEVCGFKKYFSEANVIGCDTLPKVKPDPMPMEWLMARAAISPPDCWMVGDSAVDMALARNAVAHAVAIEYGYGQASASHPDARMTTPADLLTILGIKPSAL